MKIGIDISQTAYEKTGVSSYLSNLVTELLEHDPENEYILFFSSLRGVINASFKKKILELQRNNKKIQLRIFRFPPFLLDIVWNKLHIMPIENIIGAVDIFISSDWTEPPVRHAKKATILYDLMVYKYPKESYNQTEFNFKTLLLKQNIVAAQKRKHSWMKKEVEFVLCISEATRNDAEEILKISKDRLYVIYPGLRL